MSAHAHGSGQGEALGALVLVAAVILAALAYIVLAERARRSPRGWSGWRTTSFVVGCDLLAVALVPRLLPYPDGGFREHMLAHLLVGMVAPILLVLAAPVTLVLRSIPPARGRQVVRVLRSRPVAFLAHPVVALALNVGGMAALYTTPLYAAMMESAALHLFVHVHFLAAGCLFAWMIAGPDPAPDRPSVPARLVVLGVAIAAHATLSQLLYAGLFVDVPVSAAERRGGAELMYYGGDLAELALAFALVSSWRPARRPASAIDQKRTTGSRDARSPVPSPAAASARSITISTAPTPNTAMDALERSRDSVPSS